MFFGKAKRAPGKEEPSSSASGIAPEISNRSPPPMDTFIDKAALDAGLEAGPELIGAIDQGTSSTRFVIFTPKGDLAASAQVEHTQIFPSRHDQIGWHEQDPLEIWNNVRRCIETVIKLLQHEAGIYFDERPIASIGITNQRESVVAWDAKTGLPYHNLIVWDDTRTTNMIEEWKCGSKTISQDKIREKTGLPLASYFSGTKVKWLIDNVSELQESLKDPARRENVRFGTVDTWVVYQLTGSEPADVTSDSSYQGNIGGLFVTDVTNASRWLFMDLATLKWDFENLVNVLCAPHKLPETALPAICPSSQVYATCDQACGIEAIDGVPIGAILGDQQAALFGQCAFSAGEAKNTYGTGLFLMMNTGTVRTASTHGLLTTVAYQLGRPQPQNDVDEDEGSEVMVHATDSDEDDERYKVRYALEGSVSHSGSTIQWLRDQLGIIKNAAESETLAKSTTQNDGLYMVPAFSGLFAPRWRSDARACLVGMAASHHKGHICRAALEATAYQTRDVFAAIHADSGVELSSLKVDGGGTHNKLLMQFQADIINVPVIQPRVLETTSMGAAFAAGLAVGVWKDLDEIRRLWSVAVTYKPSMSVEERTQNWAGWEKAVTKSLGWVNVSMEHDNEDVDTSTSMLPPSPPGMKKEDAPLLEAKSDEPLLEAGSDEPLLEAESDDCIALKPAEVSVPIEAEKIKRKVHFADDEETVPTATLGEFSTVSVVLLTVCGIAVGFLLGGRYRKSA